MDISEYGDPIAIGSGLTNRKEYFTTTFFFTRTGG